MPEITFQKFKGINNVQDAWTLGEDEFVSGMNVEIDDQFRLRSRDGIVLRIADASHSGFGIGTFALYRTGSVLKRIDADYSVRTLLTGLADRRVAYTKIGNFIYFTDGLKTYRTDGVGVVQAGIDPPTGQPDAASTGSGALPAATYQFAMTYVADDGRESPTGVSGLVGATGGIDFDNIPVSDDAQVKSKRIYLTRPNGADLLLGLVLAASATNATYYGGGDLGMQCDTQFHLPTPPGSILESHNGSLLIGYGKGIWFTPPYRTSVVKPNAFLAMPNIVTIIAAMNDGFWIGTTNEIGWVTGVDGQFTQKATYGAYHGTVAYLDNSDGGQSAIIATSRGACLLADGGTFKNLTEQKYHPAGARGAAIFKRGNFNQYLAVLR